jgi:hypothetical protein
MLPRPISLMPAMSVIPLLTTLDMHLLPAMPLSSFLQPLLRRVLLGVLQAALGLHMDG